MDSPHDHQQQHCDHLILKPASWLITLTTLQVQLFLTITLDLLTPLFILHAMVKESISRGEDAVRQAQKAVGAAPGRAAGVAGRAWGVVRRAGSGVVGVVNVCMVLAAIMLLAVVLGVGVVRVWVDEPVVMEELVFFDYTDVNPTAVMEFGCVGGGGDGKKGIPFEHTYFVELELLTAEVISERGKVLARSSQPCTLLFRSLPIRVARTFIFAVPILLGFSSETQQITVRVLQHKERKLRTSAIKVTLVPRAGTSALPELYSAKIILNSKLPWRKQIVHNWKWTFYVWASLNMYIVLLIITLCCCRHLFFPARTMTISPPSVWRGRTIDDDKVVRSKGGERVADSMSARETSRRRRSMRRLLMHEFEDFSEQAGSSGFGSATSEEASDQVFGSGGFTDSESVCTDG
ncbi:hypothetical protein Sjap_009225 [Stephania japonica]|uniref:Seipin n=1 Tax=Stephania japonica TaxID=461633 RepID=A0AAP0JRQ5_9MAGN